MIADHKKKLIFYDKKKIISADGRKRNRDRKDS